MTQWQAWRRYRELYAGVRSSMLAIGLLTVVGALVVLPIPILIKLALDDAISEERTGYLLALGVGLAGLQTASAAISANRAYAEKD